MTSQMVIIGLGYSALPIPNLANYLRRWLLIETVGNKSDQMEILKLLSIWFMKILSNIIFFKYVPFCLGLSELTVSL